MSVLLICALLALSAMSQTGTTVINGNPSFNGMDNKEMQEWQIFQQMIHSGMMPSSIMQQFTQGNQQQQQIPNGNMGGMPMGMGMNSGGNRMPMNVDMGQHARDAEDAREDIMESQEEAQEDAMKAHRRAQERAQQQAQQQAQMMAMMQWAQQQQERQKQQQQQQQNGGSSISGNSNSQNGMNPFQNFGMGMNGQMHGGMGQMHGGMGQMNGGMGQMSMFPGFNMGQMTGHQQQHHPFPAFEAMHPPKLLSSAHNPCENPEDFIVGYGCVENLSQRTPFLAKVRSNPGQMHGGMGQMHGGMGQMPGGMGQMNGGMGQMPMFPGFNMGQMTGHQQQHHPFPAFGGDGMDSEDMERFIRAGGNVNNLPPPTDGIDSGDMWMYFGSKYDPRRFIPGFGANAGSQTPQAPQQPSQSDSGSPTLRARAGGQTFAQGSWPIPGTPQHSQQLPFIPPAMRGYINGQWGGHIPPPPQFMDEFEYKPENRRRKL